MSVRLGSMDASVPSRHAPSTLRWYPPIHDSTLIRWRARWIGLRFTFEITSSSTPKYLVGIVVAGGGGGLVCASSLWRACALAVREPATAGFSLCRESSLAVREFGTVIGRLATACPAVSALFGRGACAVACAVVRRFRLGMLSAIIGSMSSRRSLA